MLITHCYDLKRHSHFNYANSEPFCSDKPKLGWLVCPRVASSVWNLLDWSMRNLSCKRGLHLQACQVQLLSPKTKNKTSALTFRFSEHHSWKAVMASLLGRGCYLGGVYDKWLGSQQTNISGFHTCESQGLAKHKSQQASPTESPNTLEAFSATASLFRKKKSYKLE